MKKSPNFFSREIKIISFFHFRGSTSISLPKFKRAPMQYDEERAYFFNNLPDELVEKVRVKGHESQQRIMPPSAKIDFNPFDNFDFS